MKRNRSFKGSVFSSRITTPFLASCLLYLTFLFSSCNQFNKNSAVKKKAKVDSISIIEIIKHEGSKLDQKKLFKICDSYKIKREDILVWNNIIVILARERNLWSGELEYWLLHTLSPKDEIKDFKKPFYIFDRSKCTDTTTAKQWDNVVLTANLVADPKMQQEYLNYHATQFQKWPEVSQGFCNASFQQLLVFKNGRQLMLVISIPKGKSLNELNPLTSKNNPRVDEWNKLMSKYQEGIPGTKKGETWVFLKAVRL